MNESIKKILTKYHKHENLYVQLQKTLQTQSIFSFPDRSMQSTIYEKTKNASILND